MTLQELQELLDEQNENNKAVETKEGFVITENLIVRKDFSKPLPIIKVEGGVAVCENAKLELPVCQFIGGSVVVFENAKLELPVCQFIGRSVLVYENAKLELPVCQYIGENVLVFENAKLELPVCQYIGRNVAVYENAKLELPECQYIDGFVTVHENAKLERSVCQYIGGSVAVYKNAKLELPVCPKEYINWGKIDGEMRGNVLFADGLYTLVKKPQKIGKYTVYRGAVPGVLNVITDGKNWAHYEGDLRNGITDLQFKSEKRDKYANYSLEDTVSYEEAVTMYRFITGACMAGIKEFVKTIEIKDNYTIHEIVNITKNQYGNDVFSTFFSK